MKITKYFGINIPEKYQSSQERALAFALGRLDRNDKAQLEKIVTCNEQVREFRRELRPYEELPSDASSHQKMRSLAYDCGRGKLPETRFDPKTIAKPRPFMMPASNGSVVHSGPDMYSILTRIAENPTFIPWNCWDELEPIGYMGPGISSKDMKWDRIAELDKDQD